MRLNNIDRSVSDFVVLHDEKWLVGQRYAGRIVSQTLSMLEQLVREKSSLSLIEMNKIAEEFIEKNDCSPTFRGYKDFPCGVCISINKQLVHGIPSEYKLQEGDVVKFDLGATTSEGAIADAAISCIYGTPKSKTHVELVNDTQQSLYAGIRAMTIGKKIGVIGHAIYRSLKDKYDVITNYGGHGLLYNKPHAQPFIANRALLSEGVRIQPGLTIAIEPQAVLKTNSPFTKVANDHWTVNVADIASHWEHSIYVHDTHIELITHRENELIPREIEFAK
jgi:methionyl aminopeptidase